MSKGHKYKYLVILRGLTNNIAISRQSSEQWSEGVPKAGFRGVGSKNYTSMKGFKTEFYIKRYSIRVLNLIFLTVGPFLAPKNEFFYPKVGFRGVELKNYTSMKVFKIEFYIRRYPIRELNFIF